MPEKPHSVSGSAALDSVSRGEGPQALTPLTPTTGPSPVNAATSIEAAQAARPVDAAIPLAAPSAVKRSALVSSLAQRLRGGQLSVEQAVDELIDEVVRSNLQGDAAQALSVRLREALRTHVHEDPFLLARVKQIENKK